MLTKTNVLPRNTKQKKHFSNSKHPHRRPIEMPITNDGSSYIVKYFFVQLITNNHIKRKMCRNTVFSSYNIKAIILNFSYIRITFVHNFIRSSIIICISSNAARTMRLIYSAWPTQRTKTCSITNNPNTY